MSAGLLQELIKILNISPSLLFYDPDVQITDETYLEAIDLIIRRELESSMINIKQEIYKHIETEESRDKSGDSKDT